MPYFLPHSKTMLLLSIYNFSVTESSTGISLLGRRKLVIQVLILQSMVFTHFRRYYVGKLWNSLNVVPRSTMNTNGETEN